LYNISDDNGGSLMADGKKTRPGRVARAMGGPELQFSSTLKDLRTDAGLSIRALAGLSGVGESTLQKYESTKSLPGLGEIRRLSEALGRSAHYLVFGHEWDGPLQRPNAVFFDCDVDVEGNVNEALYVARVGAALKALPVDDRLAFEQVIASLLKACLGGRRMAAIGAGALGELETLQESASKEADSLDMDFTGKPTD
jgi:transcriptional regulator with XRE-family HTH domain